MRNFSGGNDIEFPAAYERAVRSKIIGGAQKKFLIAYARSQEVYDFLRGYQDEEKESFLKSMAVNLFEDYGKLSEKQYLAVCNIIDKFAERRNAYKAAVDAQKAKSEYLGIVNEKISLRLVVESVIRVNAPKFSYYDSDSQEIYLMRDEAGNRVIYKSKSYFCFKFPAKQSLSDDYFFIRAGMVIYVNASIKAQVEYQGEKQTIIQRPKVVGVEYADNDLKDVIDKTN